MTLFFVFAVYLPIDSWQNELLEEISVRAEEKLAFPSMRPYDIAIFGSPDYVYSNERLWLPNISGEVRYDTVSVLRIKPALYYTWLEFSVCVQPVFKFGDDSLPPYRVFQLSDRDLFSADYERAYVKYTGEHFGAFIGRERFAVGPSPRYNLILSGHTAPMDWLGFFLQSKKLRFSFLLTRLDEMDTKPLEYVGDTITQYIEARRYLTVKRLDFSPFQWLNFGLSEAAIFGGENYALELYHLNPVIFIQAYQYNWGDDVNFFLNFDAKVFFNDMAIYAALLLDDFQMEEDSNGEPNHWGFNVGIEIADIIGIDNSFLLLEYTAVSRYTYCHFVPYQRYQYLETSIGSPYGPDYDELFAKFIYHFTEKVDIFTQLVFLRKGQGNISAIWPIPEYPRQPGTYFPEDNFLSGTVKKTINVGIGARCFLTNKLAAELFVGFLHADNAENIFGNQESSAVLHLQMDVLNF